MRKLKIAYFGTPYFSARFLEKLLTDVSLSRLIELKLVVTQRDQPVGRRQILTPSPVKQIAQKYKIKVADDFKSYQILGPTLEGIDFAFLFAYGISLGVIPKDILNIPRYGFLNTHPSLLPKYRGASPLAYPLMFGDTTTGVTLIKLDEEVDHGPIIVQEEMKISPHYRRPDLETKLTDLAYELFKETVRMLMSSKSNELHLKPQIHSQATFTRKLEKTDGFIPFSTLKKARNNEALMVKEIPSIIKEYLDRYTHFNMLERGDRISKDPTGRSHLARAFQDDSAKTIFNLFRGLSPWPGIWTLVKIKDHERRLKIIEMDLTNEKLVFKKVQLEGKKGVDFETFNEAYKVF